MSNLANIRKFINREKLYIWLLIFILGVNVFILFAKPKESPEELEMRQAEQRILKEEYSLTPQKLQALIEEKREVVIAMNFLVILVIIIFILGLILDFSFLFYKPNEITLSEESEFKISWDLWDVCKAVILFLFFGYLLVIIEAVFVKIFPFVKEKGHIRMMINSSILDTIVVAFILYTVLVKFKEKLKNLGLSVTHFFKNVFIGITGYVATFPLIIGALIFVIWISRLINYEPPLEPILRLFLEEKNIPVLLYSTIFVTIFGPIFEEIFFRGFMYSALKKRIGIIGAVVISAFLFSLLHTNVIGFLPIMVLGALLAYLYEKTKSLVPSIIVHIIHNTGMMIFVFLMKEIKL